MAAPSINPPLIDPPYLRGEEIQRQPHWPRDVGGIIAGYAEHTLRERFELMALKAHDSFNKIRICHMGPSYIDMKQLPSGYVCIVSLHSGAEWCCPGLTLDDILDTHILARVWPFNIIHASTRDHALANYAAGLSTLLGQW